MNEKTRITRTLLEKPVEQLSDAEKAAVKEFKDLRELHFKRLDEENSRISKECKILCSGRERSPIPDYGWTEPVKRLCYALENLNHDFKRYGATVVLDDSKEKYGTLRFYTHIETREIGLLGVVIRPLDTISNLLSRINYGPKTVVDRGEYRTLEWREITKEQFDSRTNEAGTPLTASGRNVKEMESRAACLGEEWEEDKTVYMVKTDGKFMYSYVLHHMPKAHVEFTKHRLLKKLKDVLMSFSLFLGKTYREPAVQAVKIQELDYRTDELVMKAENECMKRCQRCGTEFGSYYRKCETQGWYMYMCQRCADSTGMEYVKDGKHYIEGVQIESKEPKVKPKPENEEE